MTLPVTYTEMHSPDLAATAAFCQTVFGWEPQPFADPRQEAYRIAPIRRTGLVTTARL